MILCSNTILWSVNLIIRTSLKNIFYAHGLSFRDFEYVLYKNSLCCHRPLVFLFLFGCFVFASFTLLMILPRPFDNLSYMGIEETRVLLLFCVLKAWKHGKYWEKKNKLSQSFRNTLGKHLQCKRFVRVALLWRSDACAVLYCEVSCGTTMAVANNDNVSHVPSFGWYRTHGRGVLHENQTTFFYFSAHLFYII